MMCYLSRRRDNWINYFRNGSSNMKTKTCIFIFRYLFSEFLYNFEENAFLLFQVFFFYSFFHLIMKNTSSNKKHATLEIVQHHEGHYYHLLLKEDFTPQRYLRNNCIPISIGRAIQHSFILLSPMICSMSNFSHHQNSDSLKLMSLCLETPHNTSD